MPTLEEDVIAALDTIVPLGGRNFSDQAPDGTVLPYTVSRFDISENPLLRGDGLTLVTTRLIQVDLWEARSAEDPELRVTMWRTLDGRELSRAFRLAVRSALRIPDPDFDLLHRAFTVAAAQRVVHV